MLLKILKNLTVTALPLVPLHGSAVAAEQSPEDFYKLETKDIRGKLLKFETFRGKPVVIINTASKCGYTGQYDGLEKVYKKYRDEGLEMVAFPSNDFGGQEPGAEAEIAKFCKLNYGVTFALANKVKTKGEGQSDIFRYLTKNAPEKGDVRWNFEKFVVNRKGEIIARFRSGTKPMSAEMDAAIAMALKG